MRVQSENIRRNFDNHVIAENGNARQGHRLGKHVDDEKLVFHLVLAVVGADNLSLVDRADEDRRRPVALRC